MKPSSGLDRVREMKHPLAVLLIVGLAVRLVLMPFLSFNIDLTYWMKTVNLIDGGMDLYSIDGYYYSPIWGYVLGAVDMLAHLLGMTDYGTLVPEMYPYMGRDYSISPYVTSISFNVLIKIPVVLTDIAVGWLLYSFVLKVTGDRGKAFLACILWILCPLTIVESSMHAMFDNMSAMFTLMAFIAVYQRKYIIGGAVYGLAILTKFFPLFFIFLMVAMVVRNEGFRMKAVADIAKAIAAALVAFLIVELPAIINGQFWRSLNFITERVGMHASSLESYGTYVLIGLAVLAFLIAAAAHYFCRIRPDILREKFIDLPAEEREHRVRRIMAVSAIAITVLVLLYAVYSVASSGKFDIVDLFGLISKRAVLLLSLYTLILEGYVAYRLIFSPREGIEPYLAAFMISAALIFLWPPSPQYVVVIVPALALYAAVASERMIKPVLIACSLLALYDIILTGPSILFSVAVYTDMISLSSLMPMVDFITSYVGSIPTVAFFMAVFGGASYAALLYMIYRGISIHRREVQ